MCEWAAAETTSWSNPAPVGIRTIEPLTMDKNLCLSTLFLFLFVPFPLVILSHWNKNISTMAAKTSQAAVEIRFLLHEEESVPRRLNWIHLSLSLARSFLDIYGELVFARRWKSRRGGEKGGWPSGGRRRERRQRSWRRFVAVAGDRLLLILSAELQSCRLPRSLFPIFYGSGCSLTVRRFYL